MPHFYLTADVAIDRLIALREDVNSAAPKDKEGHPPYKLSLNDFVIRALALALATASPPRTRSGPATASLRFRQSDIGVAVALDEAAWSRQSFAARRDVNRSAPSSAEMKDFAVRARDKKLARADYQGGASAVSDRSACMACASFSAIINPPQATILAVGAARRKRSRTADGSVAFASMLSCDAVVRSSRRRWRARRGPMAAFKILLNPRWQGCWCKACWCEHAGVSMLV